MVLHTKKHSDTERKSYNGFHDNIYKINTFLSLHPWPLPNNRHKMVHILCISWIVLCSELSNEAMCRQRAIMCSNKAHGSSQKSVLVMEESHLQSIPGNTKRFMKQKDYLNKIRVTNQ